MIDNSYDHRLDIAITKALEHHESDLARVADLHDVEEADLQHALCPVCTNDLDMPWICPSCEHNGHYWSAPSYFSSDGLPTLRGPGPD